MQSDLAIIAWLSNPSDMEVISRLLRQAGLELRTCGDIDSLITQAAKDFGALLIEENSLTAGTIKKLNTFLAGQPPWSDPPVILMANAGATAALPRPWPQWLPNLTVLNRPIPSAALVSVLLMTLRARQRQYQVRDLLANVQDLNRNLQKRMAELASTAAQLRALAGELTLTEQRERQRMAKVLHDDLQQLLVGATFHAAALSRSKDPAVGEKAKTVNDLLGQALAASRSLTTELSPPVLHEGGLDTALKWLAGWMAEKHGFLVEVTTDADLPLPAQDVKILLFESVRELLFNAVKHSKVRSATVHAHCLSNRIWIVVCDKGAGFDPAITKHASPGSGGFGLLSIRERLALISGQMEIDSAPGRGSRFVLSAPLDVVSAAPSPAALIDAMASVEPRVRPALSQRGQIRVLLADDHAVVRRGLAQLLSQEPDIQIVAEVSNGMEAIELVRDLRPDVVLMDVNMPELNGIEATRRIMAEMPDTKVIGLSMFQQSEKGEAMQAAGACAYLSKSGSAEEVVATIRSVCRDPHYAGR